MRNRLIIGIIVLLLITGITVGLTYAFFQYSKVGTKTLSFETGSINLDLGEVGNGISLTDQFPMSDEAGMSQATTYSFTISGYNTGTDPIYYEVLAVLGNDVVDKTRFNDDEIKLYITDGIGTTVYGPNSPYEMSSNGSLLLIDTIPGGTAVGTPVTRNYILRFWLNTERILISETDYVPGKNAYTPTEFHNKYASVNIQVKGDMTPKSMPPTILEKINTDLSANLYTPAGDTDQTFIVGTASDNNYKPNNYLWYSGKMWRIVALNKTDGVVMSIKIITQNLMTSIYRNGTVENGGSGESAVYEGSYMYQWFNEDFYETLRNPGYIVTNYLWNATQMVNGNKPPNTTMVTAPVGSLNRYEYAKSYTNTTGANGYLNFAYIWWLINPYNSNSSNGVSDTGSVFYQTYDNSYPIRPAINLKANILISGGNGTVNNPYRLSGDNDQEADIVNNNINTRYSGEYVKFNNEDYRIVKIDGNLTKIVKIDYIRSSGTPLTKNFAFVNSLYSTSISCGINCWGGYLNNESTGWYSTLSVNDKNMIETGTWYSGAVTNKTSYKKSICATVNPLTSGGTLTNTCIKTSVSTTAKVGLIRLGELFSTQLDPGGISVATHYYLLTPTSENLVFYLNNYSSLVSTSSTNLFSTRLALYLKSSVKIAGGDGTPSNPFTLTI